MGIEVVPSLSVDSSRLLIMSDTDDFAEDGMRIVLEAVTTTIEEEPQNVAQSPALDITYTSSSSKLNQSSSTATSSTSQSSTTASASTSSRNNLRGYDSSNSRNHLRGIQNAADGYNP